MAGALWGIVIWFVARLVLGFYVVHTTGQDLPPGPHRVMVQELAVLRFFAQYDLWFKLGAAAAAVWGTWTRRLPGTDPDRPTRVSVPAGGTPWEPWETPPTIWGDNAPEAPDPFMPQARSPMPTDPFMPQAQPPMAVPRRPCQCGGVNKVCPQCRGMRGTWLHPAGEQGSDVWVPCPRCLGSGQVQCTDCDE